MAVAEVHTHEHSSLLIMERDPTRTLTLRNQFSREMAARFRRLRGLIRKAVVEEDVFALKQGSGGFAVQQMTTPGRHAFDFPRSGDKVNAFTAWLKRQEQIGILETTQVAQLGVGVEAPWTNTYIQSSYQRGIQRARQELIAKGYPAPPLEGAEALTAAFNNPFHVDRVGLLYTRVFSNLEGITAQMDTQISQVLAQAMAEGRGPNEIARLLTRTISGPAGDLGITDTLGRFIPAERRARILARTEIIRAHHMAMIQEYRNFEVVGVKVKAEWSTALDARVCFLCAPLEGKIFTLNQIEGMIPRHAQCRCISIPVDVTDEGKGVEEPPAERLIWEPVSDVSGIKTALQRVGFESVITDMRGPAAIARVNYYGEHISAVFNNRSGLYNRVTSGELSLMLDMSNDRIIPMPGGGKAAGLYNIRRRRITLPGRAGKKGDFGIGPSAWAVDDSALGNFRHEYGHGIYQEILGVDERQRWKDLFKELGRNKYFAKEVSTYAGANPMEAFAESFTAWTHFEYGTTAGKTLPRVIEEFFEEMF